MFNDKIIVFENPRFEMPKFSFEFSEEKKKEEKNIEIEIIHSNKIGRKKRNRLF